MILLTVIWVGSRLYSVLLKGLGTLEEEELRGEGYGFCWRGFCGRRCYQRIASSLTRPVSIAL